MHKRTEELTNSFHAPSKTYTEGSESLLNSLPMYSIFADHHKSKRCPSEKTTKGLRVVTKSWEFEKEIILGTVVGVSKDGKDVTVQWDTPQKKGSSNEPVKLSTLRLFDNAGTGVVHDYVACDECNTYPLRGLRWRCVNCDNYDLCTVCYMNDAHNLSHIFERIKRKDSQGVEIPPRLPLELSGYAYASGILQYAEVSLREDNEKKGKGVVLAVCGVENGIDVQWFTNGNKTSRHNILDLQCGDEDKDLESIAFYPDHLPVLQKGDTFDDIDVPNNDEDTAHKVQFNIRNLELSKREQKSSNKPILYLIIDNHQDKCKKEERFSLMNEVLEYSRKTKLPCHVVGQKVLFLHGSSDTVCTHFDTDKEIVEELLGKGCLIFEKGDTAKKTSEIDYFIRMAKYMLGEKVIPVLIPLHNVKRGKEPSLSVPIVRFKKTSQDVTFFVPKPRKEKENEKGKENKKEKGELTEYSTTLRSPWIVTKSEMNHQKEKEKAASTYKKNKIESISSFKDVQSTLDLDALICDVSIGVSMTNEVYGMDKELYIDALSMYLLKNGKWRIPKDAFKTSFSFPCIKYIYEKDLTTAFANGLHADLKTLTTLEHVSKHLNEEEIQNAVSKSDVIGLIFLALLRNQFYTGAIQLVDTGFVCIRHILVGCKILQDASNDKKNEQIQRETSQRLKLYFTERATLITRFINEATKKNDVVEKELGETANHAGRLLLNHRYLEDAIKTENKTFIENETVTDILHKMWYGEEKSLIRQIGFCFLLSVLHILMMPLLMINVKARPLRWFYKKYNLPFMKALIQMLGYLALLVAYAYMLLFNLNDELSYTDLLIIGWMISFWLNETKQAIVSVLRKRFKRYISSWWNRLDWALMLAYTIGMSLKFADNGIHEDASKIFLVVTFILLSIRILNMFSISEFLGPKLVIIQKMFKDTFVFLIILTVIMMSYNVSFHSLLYPNSELSWEEIEKVMQNGYWMLFGELNLDSDTLTDCTFNKTIYTSGAVRRCPTSMGLHISPYLKALYELIAVILLLNLLIAIYSDTYQKVNDECKFHWSQLQTDFLEEYSVQTIFPIHLQLLVLPFFLIHVIIWCIKYCCYKIKNRPLSKVKHRDDQGSSNSSDDIQVQKRSEHPLFVLVFLYNANFDLKLTSTEEAERIGAIKSKWKIEITEEDKITKLQKQIDDTNRTLDEHLNRNDEMLKIILDNVKEIKSKIHGEFIDKECQTEST
ncbi:uncharacterized protein LOC127712112 isoform X27 [Mytilus californianus]|uniref:uncharacterized protein LOC127712112 isoform X27 n=1 Tax=Mytilus californianus TaxID=6549 RepID=UPI002247F702|nr:uncharacterized protein LOC127712112 isoform X27 [Mytilus californianus]